MDRTYEVSSTMALRGASKLDSDAIDAWMEETQERIRGETEEVGNRPLVTVIFYRQNGFFERRALKRQDADAVALTSAGSKMASQFRHLGKEQSPLLQIDFTTIIEAKRNDWDPNEIVAAGFKTPSQQTEYIYSLKAADSASFESVHGMTMEVEGTIITGEPSRLIAVRAATGNGAAQPDHSYRDRRRGRRHPPPPSCRRYWCHVP